MLFPWELLLQGWESFWRARTCAIFVFSRMQYPTQRRTSFWQRPSYPGWEFCRQIQLTMEFSNSYLKQTKVEDYQIVYGWSKGEVCGGERGGEITYRQSILVICGSYIHKATMNGVSANIESSLLGEFGLGSCERLVTMFSLIHQ